MGQKDKDTAIPQEEHINAVIPDGHISARGSQEPRFGPPFPLLCPHLPSGQAGFEVSDYTNSAARASNWKCSTSTLPPQALPCPTCSTVSSLLEATAV